MFLMFEGLLSSTPPIEILVNVGRVIDSNKKEKETISDLLFNVAPLTFLLSNQLVADVKKIYDLRGFIKTEPRQGVFL